MKIGFLLYPVSKVKVTEDTSFWIMHELSSRGHDVFHFESHEMAWRDGAPRARLWKARTHASKGFLTSAPPPPKAANLRALDAVFVRKEPPFDTGYLHALQLLETVKDRVFVINDPAGIAMANEKLAILNFPKRIPETLVTQDPAEAKRFVRDLGGPAVLKALNGKGGAGIFATASTDRNLPSLVEAATSFGTRAVMIQRFVPADRFGDKRLLVLDGKILGSFLRRPSAGDFRANLGVGGTLHKAPPTREDRELVEEMAPWLSRYGLHFVGIDVIGRWLTEINVTSPSGIADLIALGQGHPERAVADFLEKKTGN